MAPPKALLFDIGGVCVVSPFQAILDYEILHSIPPGYINHTISSTAPNGSWQRIERGELTLNDEFFRLFRAELEDPARWKAHWSRILADPSKQNLLPKGYNRERVGGDGVPEVAKINAKEMFWNMMRTARSPDPNMYPALKKLRESGKFIIAALSNTIAFPPGIRDEKGDLFLSGIKVSEVKALEIGSPEDGAGGGVGDEREDIKGLFDVFVSSAHVGMRKPEKRIYDFAISEVQRVGREKGIEVQAGDITFLDDIGSNLKAAKQAGLGTIKVTLGRSRDAVRELEKVVGMSLLQGGDSKL